jgi:hypothetical protein
MPESSNVNRNPFDPLLKEELRSLGDKDWQRIFLDMLRGLPLLYNIDFSDSHPGVRIKELYDQIIRNGLDPLPLQMAIVRLLQEYYREPTNGVPIYYLILAIDHIRPGMYYDRLLQLVVKPEYAEMTAVEGPDKLSVHYRLLNAIMRFDLDRRLLGWLFSQSFKAQRLEFYQIAIRYLYSYCGQQEFNRFMNTVYIFFGDKGIRGTALGAFQEYLFYEKEFRLLVGWLAELRPALQDDPDYPAFALLADGIMTWLEADEKRLESKKGYREVCWYLYIFIRRDLDDPGAGDEVIKELKKARPEDFYDREKLIRYLRDFVIGIPATADTPPGPVNRGSLLLDPVLVRSSIIAPASADRTTMHGVAAYPPGQQDTKDGPY